MKKILLGILAGFAGWLIYSVIALNVNKQHYEEQEYTEEYVVEYSKPADNELEQILKNIAGTYELVEQTGSYGYENIYTIVVYKEGYGKITYADGSGEYFYSAQLKDSNTIVFNGDYGGTVFLLAGPGIEDEACRKYFNEIGTPKYYMRKL